VSFAFYYIFLSLWREHVWFTKYVLKIGIVGRSESRCIRAALWLSCRHRD